jgi:hypothetical protein
MYINNTKIEIKANYQIARKYLPYVIGYITPSDKHKKELLNALRGRVDSINNRIDLIDHI